MHQSYQTGGRLGFKLGLPLFVILFCVSFSFSSFANKKFYHYTPEGKAFFELSAKKVLIKFSANLPLSDQAKILSSEPLLKPLTEDMAIPSPKALLAELVKDAQEKDILDLIARLNRVAEIEYANPFLVFEDGTSEAAQNRIAIKLKDAGDFVRMEEVVKRNGAIIQEQYKYDPLLFFILVNKQSTARALELANLFAETQLFAASEPDMLKLLKRFNTNDTFLSYQWSLNNTGSSQQFSGTAGADMKVFSAWGISTGSSTIKVAVIDEGVDLAHPDLLANLLPGFDGTGLGSSGGPSGNDAHGTNCAGIIAAVGNNNLGVAGVAYNCKIVPVRIAYSSGSSWVTTNAQIGTSIDWAWNQGAADVLSNSWGGGSSSTLINDPITRATTLGRGGLGAPVLFAAGNANSANSYPATLTNVISVVAMSMCDKRKTPTSCDGETWWGSNFGTGVDVAAPGVKIYSTDISGSAGYSTGDYYATFNGTSSATPNTSGVMALILSVNPTLTATQARQILESSCDKTGGYTYNSGVSGQPNGTWSTDLGYGRVNAYTALQLANPQPCAQPTIGGTASGPSTLVAGVSGTFTLTGYNGTNIQWQSSSNSGVSWSDVGGATSASSSFTLGGGTYLVRASVTRINCTASYSNNLSVSVSAPVGDVFANPIIISSLPYTTSVSNATGFNNDYTGTNNQASADIFYRLTTGPCTDSLKISTCGTAFDDYIHLLNSAGTNIISNDDNGPLCTGTAASIKAAVTPNTIYYVVVEGYSTNTGTIQLSISQVDNPVYTTNISAGGPTTFCQGGSVTLTAAGGSSYLWSTGATSQAITVTAGGNYSVTVTNANGCAASASQSVTVNSLPAATISAGGPTTFCEGGSVVLTSSAGSSYLWSNGATSQSITATAAGNYLVTVTNGNGCSLLSAPTSVTINPIPTPTIGVGGPTTFCAGGSVALTSSSANGNLWSNGATSQSITATTSGNYTVSVTANGCTGTSAGTSVTSNPLPAQYSVAGGGSYCTVPGTGVNVYLNNSQLGVNYDFKFTAGGSAGVVAGNGGPIFVSNVTQGGTIYVVATNALTSCQASMSGSASVVPNTAFTLYADADGDGYGDLVNSIQTCSTQPGYVTDNTDCNDVDGSVHSPQSYFIDADGDGFGSSTTAMVCSSVATAGYSTNSSDCNDSNAGANPGALEICGNLIDDNCNGSVDEDCTIYTFYQDTDGDGYGNPNSSITSSIPLVPPGYVTNSSDCNDGNAAINPGAAEICNGLDDNCDGTVDNGTPALANSTSISGPAGVCRNSTGQVFTTAAIPGASSYIWTLPAGATGSSSTNSITLSFSSTYVTGNICVRAANSCVQATNFCRSIVYYSAKPATPGTISGPATGVCAGSTQTYSITAVTNATNYNWTAPTNATIVGGQGTTTATVSFNASFTSGTLSVNASNCVAGTSSNKTLALASKPGTPTSIAGTLLGACPGSTKTYSCTSVNGATMYNWTFPANTTINSGQGTNSINVTLPAVYSSGTISVTAGNACGVSTVRSATVRSVPSAPSITGSSSGVCSGTTQTYNCSASTTGATLYNWTVMAGATINSGQGTTSISVTLPAAYSSGTISVNASNACGNSTTTSLTVRSVPAQPGTITGATSNLCNGGILNYSITAVAGATGYSWTPPSGCTILSNNGNSISMIVPGGFVSGTLSVTADNGCGSSTARTLAMVGKPATPAAISGPTSVCPSATGVVFSTTAIAGLTYTWTKPTSVTIASGQGTATMTANWGSVAGSVTVKASNACGTSATTSKSVAIAACKLALNDQENSEDALTGADLVVYPNPGSGIYQLKLSGLDSDGSVNIYNMQGKLILSQTLPGNTLQNSLDLTSQPIGTYLIRYQSESFHKEVMVVKE